VDKVKIDSDAGMVAFSVSEIKGIAEYVSLTDALRNFEIEYVSNLASVVNGSITKEIAQNVGYKGL
jgi:hypothetical protein